MRWIPDPRYPGSELLACGNHPPFGDAFPPARYERVVSAARELVSNPPAGGPVQLMYVPARAWANLLAAVDDLDA